MPSPYEYLATGRSSSLFAEDVREHAAELDREIGGSRVAVVGAAGSIGSSVVRSLLAHRPRALVLVDLSENNLVEIVRELRSDPTIAMPEDFATLPIGLGSLECSRYFRESAPFDFILNLAAMKHVRSEKDVYCLIRMIDTNVLHPHALLRELPQPCRKFFSVSSDKATRPANLMGASKMLMEKVLLMESPRQPFSTARFANVAFSDGSLPHGFLMRIAKHQPIAAPDDVRRYFMSHEEAGQICVLSCVLGENRDVFFPNLARELGEKTFAAIARDLLRELDYEPVACGSEEEARARASELIPQRKWPCWFFRSDTSGEKPFEEFHTAAEKLDFARFAHIGIVKQSEADVDGRAVADFLRFATAARSDPEIGKADYVRELRRVVPDLDHIETGKNLDQKM
ncbi:MAG: polysaccharide biosynthesis protein [Polyangiaceae bacterium]|nr:polysaccharide biosynthesis protein [Polyangiaceae bacterium]